MDFGVCADVTDYTVRVTDLAKAVEDSGLESLFLTHHSHLPADRLDLMADPFHTMDAQLLDPFVALGAAAAVTSRLTIGTGVYQVPLLDPIVLAKQVATLDHLSGGRFLFGVGVGSFHGEIRNHGVEPSQRFDVFRERILAMKAIWTQEQAEFHGRFVAFDPIHLEPKPVQKPHPPILIGLNGPRALGWTVELGDGWAPIITEAAQIDGRVAELHRLCALAGRGALPVTVFLLEVDEALIERCADLGVARCVVYAFPEDTNVLTTLLDRWSLLAVRYRLH